MQPSEHSRRQLLRTSAGLVAGAVLIGSARQTAAESATPTAQATLENRQGKFVEVNGANIFYQMTGSGQPMLLIHGYPLSGALFDRNRDALSQHYQVITIDQRGYGMSKTPDVPDKISTYAKDALSVLDKLNVKQAIIGGHSMGGPVTLEMYKTDPKRFKGMILIDTNAAAASAIEAGLWKGFDSYVQKNGLDATYVGALMENMLTGATRMKQPDQVLFLTDVIKAASKDAALGGARALGSRSDYTSLLAQINVPTLVFVGEDDPLYSYEISKMMQAAIPGSQLATISGAAHAAIYEAPDASNKAILDWAGSIG